MVTKTKSTVAVIQDVDDNSKICCLCADEIKVWAIGVCKHPVCYVCSSRMRVLNSQHECAICKQEMETVVFHDSIFDFSSINITSLKKEAEHGIAFFTQDSVTLFKELRLEKCGICKGDKQFVGKDAKELKQHMSRKHALFSCQLCTDNYLLFPAERRWYNRTDLARHRREGDPDNTSHKGHPACKFCDERFLDDHELYRHLRKEHFTCHICEAEEGTRDFLETVKELVKHFRKKHFLCEHRDCVDNPLVSVFKTELDLKIHVADKHGGIDKKDLRIDVGVSRNNHQRRQEEIEEEILEVANQQLPDMQSEELFPTLGKRQFMGTETNAGGNASLAAKLGTRNVSHSTNYKRLTGANNLSNAEEFPTLGGAGPVAPKSAPNWSKKATQNNRPVTKTRSQPISKQRSPEPDYPSLSSASRLAADHSTTQWSQEPDVFVEKSQLQLRAEKEEAKRQNQKAKNKAAPQRDHQQFPTLGGGGAKPNAFWGVPGNSIPKTKSKKQKKKALPVPDALPGQQSRKAEPASRTPEAITIKAVPTVTTVERGAVNSAQDIAARLTGGYSGWSAPPETFEAKSLIEIEDQKRKNKEKTKKQNVPKQADFPTLGGGKKTGNATPTASWGVPGNSFPKSAAKNNKKSKVIAKSPKTAAPRQSPVQVQVQQKSSTKKATKVPISFSPPAAPLSDDQNASILANRMTGGYSGWSAPPTVFKEKTLLEIEAEEKAKKQSEMQQSASFDAANIQSAFPTLGGMDPSLNAKMKYEYSAKKFTKKIPSNPLQKSSSESAAEALRKAKKNETTINKVRKMNRAQMNAKENKENVQEKQTNKEKEQEQISEVESFDLVEEFPQIEIEQEEEEEEDDMDLVNQRLTTAILSLSEEDRNLFKRVSGIFRTGGLTAEEYIESGSSIMSRKSFLKLLPDLVRTLPEGKHKRALFEAHRRLSS